MQEEHIANYVWQSRRNEWLVLAAFGTGLAVSRLVTPVKPGAPLTLHGYELQSACLIRRLTGRPCLSCGLTRGVAYVARGNLRDALRANPLSPLAVVLGVGRAAV